MGCQDLLCEILEESVDRQDNIAYDEREWNPDKLNAYCAACIALELDPNHDPEILARMLRCFCDAESGGVQQTLVSACLYFCEEPYDDDVFVAEMIKAAPVMLKRSPDCFGGLMMTPMITAKAIRKPEAVKVFQSLSKEERQVIIDYWTYELEENSDDPHYKEFFATGLKDWLAVSGLKGGNSKYFKKYFGE